MPVVPSSGAEASDPKKPEKDAQAPAELAKATLPRKQTVFPVNIGSFNEGDFRRLQAHARAANLSVEEYARKKVFDGLELPPREEKLAALTGAVQIKGDWVTKKGDYGDTKLFYLQVQLDKGDRPYVKAWSALLQGMTDHYHINFLPPVEQKPHGHLIPFCLYPGSEQDLKDRIVKAGITSDISKLPVLNADSLDVISRVDLEKGVPRPIVHGFPVARLQRLIEGSQPTLTKISEQIKEARRLHSGAFRGVDSTNAEFLSLNETQVQLIDKLTRSINALTGCDKK